MPQHTRVYATEAIVLRRTDFGEADRILTLFTPAYGKARAIAKGARRTTSRLAGHLEPFTRTQLLLATGRELDIVTQAEARERLDALREDLWHATGAWYIAELVDRFLEDADPHPRLYRLFVSTLRLLDDGAAENARSGKNGNPHVALSEGTEPGARTIPPRSWLALRYFELHLLDELGYRPALHTCAGCDTPLRPEENGYNPELGGCLCPSCSRYAQRRLSLPALKVLRLLQTTEWEAVPRLRLDAHLRAEIEGTLQATLRYHLDRELKSWSFLHAVAGE
ncbi:MAG TPA: DNA repair protein RecO [Ktedonobacterales bacterium]|nr:DNA repair protein RecO [Ktedonobacterales bacterium]